MKTYFVELYKDKKIIKCKKFNTIEEVYNYTFKGFGVDFDDFNVYKLAFPDLVRYSLKQLEKVVKDN